MNKKPLIIILVILIALSLLAYFILVISKKTSSPNIITDIVSEAKISTMQGLKIEILREGTGMGAQKGDRAVVEYVGTFKDGTEFGSNINTGEPLTFVLGENDVIQGWELGVLGMKMGEKRRLTVPSSLAYGRAGRPPLIPPNASLIFEIELMAILIK